MLEPIFMNKFDGDNIFENLKNIILSGKELTELDKLNLIFLPLMKSSVDKNKMAINAIELAKEIDNNEQKLFCISAIIGVSDKFIDKNYLKELMEVLSMTKVGYLLKQEGIEVGIEVGIEDTKKKDIIKILVKRFNLVPENIKNSITSIKKIEALDKIFDEALDTDNLESFEEKVSKELEE